MFPNIIKHHLSSTNFLHKYEGTEPFILHKRGNCFVFHLTLKPFPHPSLCSVPTKSDAKPDDERLWNVFSVWMPYLTPHWFMWNKAVYSFGIYISSFSHRSQMDHKHYSSASPSGGRGISKQSTLGCDVKYVVFLYVSSSFICSFILWFQFLFPVGSQDSLLEITFRSTVPPVICEPTTPKPEVSAINLQAISPNDGTTNPFSSSNGTLGSPLGRDQCLLKLERFRFLPGPPGPPPPRLPSPPPPLKVNRSERRDQDSSEASDNLFSCEVKSLSSLDFARFRESGIASECESNTDDSDDQEDEDEGEDEEDNELDIFGWGTDEETIRLLNVLNRQGAPDCLGDEIAVWLVLVPTEKLYCWDIRKILTCCCPFTLKKLFWLKNR